MFTLSVYHHKHTSHEPARTGNSYSGWILSSSRSHYAVQAIFRTVLESVNSKATVLVSCETVDQFMLFVRAPYRKVSG
jgi:hypothetical protein